ncbi:adenylate kinase [Streptomyces sp. MS2A]|nr:adenylate kinase [Streptomyces sp. MS2A]
MPSPPDASPVLPLRVLIAGITGAGKTTFARRVAAAAGVRHVEIDALFHGAGWTPRPSFLDDVRAFAAEERWVTEWQYTSQGTDAVLVPRADLVVWLDYPWRIVRARLIRRTLARRILRTRLWNGNTEPAIWTRAAWTGEDDILRWQRRTRHKWDERMPEIVRAHPDLPIVRLRHPREAERWLRALSAARPR